MEAKQHVQNMTNDDQKPTELNRACVESAWNPLESALVVVESAAFLIFIMLCFPMHAPLPAGPNRLLLYY